MKKRRGYKPINSIYYDVSHHKDQKKLGEFDEEDEESK